MTDVSILRLYLLERSADLSHMDTVVASILGAISLLALPGIRYPIRMLPLLMFELLWKVMWVALWGLPRWADGDLDAAGREILVNCLVGIVLVPLVMPWRHVIDRYVKAPGEPWRTPAPRTHPQPTSSPAQAPTGSR